MQLGFGHDGHGRTGLGLIVDAAINDGHALQIFLDDFFTHDLDVLFGLAAGALPQAVGGMFLHLDSDLFGDVGPGRQLGNALTDQFPFAEIALALPD